MAFPQGEEEELPKKQRSLDRVLQPAGRRAASHLRAVHLRGRAPPGGVGGRGAAEDATAIEVPTAPLHRDLFDEAYDCCGEVCAEYAKIFNLGTLLMTPKRRKAIWAIYVWCRRTDELVDGPNASHITPSALDRWQKRLEDLFNGRPYDMYDAALSDTALKYPVDIQDMIEGMRMDLRKSRYNSFDEFYLYCYYVVGTVGLMSVPVVGIAQDSKASTESVYNAVSQIS